MVETFTVGDSFEWKIDGRHGYIPHKMPGDVKVKAFIKHPESEAVEVTNVAIETGYVSVFLCSADSQKLRPGKVTLI